MLFKTPLTTLVALLVMPVAVAFNRIQQMRRQTAATNPDCHWNLVCLTVPPAIFFAVAIGSNLNIGLRHVLMVYPFIFIGIGVALARFDGVWPRAVRIAGGVLALGLLIETAAAYPNYIAFFNVAADGSRGGLKLLGDSNLDWGQDLPLLAQWQKQNPDTRLYFSYFGSADPAWYGIDYINLEGGYWLGPITQPPNPSRPGVLAIGATRLQTIHEPGLREVYSHIRTWPVRKVLGGTIYIYDYPQPPQAQR
jgi:hypothetical protein